MKTAIYIEDGIVQLVITPESEFERKSMGFLDEKGELSAELFSGSFYDCRGGWVRQSAYQPPSRIYGTIRSDDESLIIRVSQKKAE